MSSLRHAATVLLALLVVAAALAGLRLLGKSGTAEDLLSELEAVTGPRPFEARLGSTGPFAPCAQDPMRPGRCAGVVQEERAAPEALSRRIRNLGARGGADSRFLRVLGLWHLFWAGAEAQERVALETLRRATVGDDADAWTDLAAASLTVWRERGRPDDLLEALEAASVALTLAPSSPTATFDRALALESLGLERDALATWVSLEDLEGDVGWQAEGRRHAGKLRASVASQGSDEGSWAGVTRQEAARRVDLNPEAAFEAFEGILVLDWAAAELADQSTDATVESLRSVATALYRTTEDRSALETVARLAGSEPGARRRIASGVTAFVAAKAAHERRDLKAACEGFHKAQSWLAQDGGALSSWTRYYLAVCRYWDAADAGVESELSSIHKAATDSRFGRLAGYASWMVGLSLIERGRLAEGITHYRTAVEELQRVHCSKATYSLRTLLADALLRLGEERAAWREVVAVLPFAESLPLPRAKVLWDRAAASATALECPEAARLFLDKAVAAASASDQPGLVVEALAARGALLADAGDEEAAKRDLAEARANLERIPDKEIQRRAATVIAMARGSDGEDQSLRGHELDEAMGYLERTGGDVLVPGLLLQRARWAWRMGDAARAEIDLRTAIEGLEHLRSLVPDERWRISHRRLTRRTTESLLALLNDQKRPAEEIAEWTDRLRRDGSTLANGASQWLERLQTADLADATALVSYSLLPDRILVWVLRGHSITLRSIPRDRAELERSIDALASTEDAAESLPLRRRLSAALISPILDLLAGVDRVFLGLDRALYRLPFSALPDPRDGTLLSDSIGFAIVPAFARLQVERLEPALPRGRAALVVGASAPGPRDGLDLAQLPAVALEAKAVAASYENASLLVGRAATPAAILDRLRSATVFHFAGHALSPIRRPEAARLVAAAGAGGSASLTADEIRHLDLGAVELVTLAACDTAATPSDDETGELSLAVSFLEGGARTVVASRLPVADDLTARFYPRLHQLLATGEPALSAFRDAQRELANDSSDLRWTNFLILTWTIR